MCFVEKRTDKVGRHRPERNDRTPAALTTNLTARGPHSTEVERYHNVAWDRFDRKNQERSNV